MPRRGENIYKRADGRWEGRILRAHTPERKPIYTYIYGRTYREVREKMERNRSAPPPRPGASGLLAGNSPFEDVARQWLQSRCHGVKDSTFAHYQRLIETHIIPELGARPLCELDENVLCGYIDALLRDGRIDRRGGLSPKTVSDILTVLKAILRYAGNRGCKIDIRLNELTIRRQCREMRVLSVQEQNRLAEALDRKRDRRSVGVMLSLYTGMRLGEVCALRRRDIDLDARTIRIRATMQRIKNMEDGCKTKIIITEPKSKCSVRDIPIPAFLLPALKRIEAPGDAFILTGTADRYVEPRSMENYFRRCVEECGIAHANYHALRHSFASRCVEAGFDIKSLSEILGHSNVSITLDRYVHSSFEQKRKNMDKLTLLCAT